MNTPRTILLCMTLSLLSGPLGPAGVADEKYSLESIGRQATDQAAELPPEAAELPPEGAELPKEIPEPFRSELSQDGLRLSRAGGHPLYELWFRKQVPLLKTGSTEMSINYGRLQVGTFVGVLRSYGGDVDYREDPIDAGFYLLRYGIQPDDGDHMGTAESRDFLVLTRFKEDRKLDPVTDMEELIDLALMASAAGDHPIILYLAAASTEEYEQPRIYRHAHRDEWIADLRLPARVGDQKQESSLRMGLVLVGVSEHF